MHAHAGERLVVRARRQGEPDRDAEILEVRGKDGAPPYVVRWSDDGHVGLFYPGSDAFVPHEGEHVAGSPVSRGARRD